jgi:formylglycine-generating enzyme required for sulfatase activity
MVQEFLTALNARYPGENFRLPTEAEWEYAARAGTTGAYGGSGVLDEMGWYQGNSQSKTHYVALKEANAWGLFDMHGNVEEWVQDLYSTTYYGESPTEDPQGPATNSNGYRVLRGGSVGRDAADARSAARSSGRPDNRGFTVYLGFRLVKDPSQ